MSEVPPSPEQPPNLPPQDFSQPQMVAYPRQGQMVFQGSAEKLQALSDSYFGLNWVFVACAVILVGGRVAISAVAMQGPGQPDPMVALAAIFGPFFLAMIVGAIMSYGPLKRAAFGMGWNPGTPAWLSIVLGVQTIFCCGAVGIVVVQHILVGEMNKYGIRGSLFGGIRKQQIQAVVEQLRSQQTMPTPPSVMPPSS